MKLGSPSTLWFLLIPLALAALALYQQRRIAGLWATFFAPALWARLLPGWDASARSRKLVFWTLGMLALLTALARPQWGSREEVLSATGLDLMLVLDLSRSMDVEDVVPSRIKKSRHFIRGMLERLQGDRVGVVAFAASSYVASPLTNDLNYVQEVVDVLAPGTLGNQGTDIGLGLETALAALERGAENTDPSASAQGTPTRAMLLITDGEDHEGEAARMAGRLKEKGIQVFVLGVGTQRGGPIPLRDDQGQLMGYKRQGRELVQSHLDPKTLEKVASASGGRYWTVSDSESERDELLKDLGALDRTRMAERKIVIPHERFQIFVLLGVALLLVEWLVPLVRPLVKRAGPIGLLLCGFGLSGPMAEASTLKSYLKNREGVSAFEQKDLERARQKFSEAGADDPGRVEPLFNQGVAELKGGAAEQAAKSFEKAIQQSKQNGDPRLSGLALYNLGSALEQSKQQGQAIRAFVETIRMARLAGDARLEQDARKRIESLQQQKQQQDQQKQDQDQKGNSENSQSQSQSQPKSGDPSQSQKNQQNKSYEDPSVSRRRAFKSEKLSAEDSERVMAELSAREKELQARLKRQRGNPSSQSGKDW